ncbi:MAG: hypothetical protein A3C70_01585 [Candidatus Zambryskibacteria bacterium RIFCSPHIGHO2_02_FULL_43_14]|uniref:Glycosyltransferase RgtA/B/C/D-like domain-containing protein n=1 Tax=Candidatus Zambryskibacteria bacterium RIFCSPHIGHO2_02_FULL_43_14 TaxID=1802748 RepID=A0A1G2TFY1_9BACT|nr:MAG: hypothetical protein A2829_03480 [Candidatus Zambryskibacteria bacterium RIFCSPHIGHO2_01_FULL_43_60]OHA96197.1 MAG: hypothetical protein A3C70_01585 [Candidatus Zambryskibacteria bacterium RIFCSPHIGHO2_02_FULL_43_14]OHB03848.1 MAG: hypothetical protein A3B03_03585 [Candidatus Zambryskibacteria bacterium RIFCSPLOWO2_01_FULL_42_41]
MLRLKQILREHKMAIIIAVFLSLITAFPQIYFRFDHKDIYQGIELLPDSPWSARAREMQDGHSNFGSIYYKDGKDNPYLFQPLGSMVVAYMGKMFSLDINNTILLSRIVLPFVVFLLIYAFVFLLSRDRLVALCSAALLLLADSALSYFGITQLLHGVSPDNFLRLARPVNPAMVYILLFSFLTAFWLFYKKKNWRYGVASVIFLGLNFYNYFYSWTYLYAFGGLLVLFLLFQKKWQEALKVTGVFIGGLLVAIPYSWNLYSATLHPVYTEASARFGVVASHLPLFVGFVVIGALIVFLLGFPREDRSKYFFSLALLLAPFVTMNQQLLTGKVLQISHYHWFFHKPVAVVFVLIVIFHLLTRRGLDFYKKTLATLVIVVSILTGVFVQASSYYYDGRDGDEIAIERQKYGPVMEWLNNNARKEAVVFGNNETSHLTVIYTPLNVFYHRAAIYSLSATKERLFEVLFTFYRLREIGTKDAREVFFKERDYISWNIYGMHYRELLGSYEAIPDEKIEEIVALYKATLSTTKPEWLKRVWSRYEVEYLVWDKKQDPLWNLDQYKFLEKMAEFGDLAIYLFRP